MTVHKCKTIADVEVGDIVLFFATEAHEIGVLVTKEPTRCNHDDSCICIVGSVGQINRQSVTPHTGIYHLPGDCPATIIRSPKEN